MIKVFELFVKLVYVYVNYVEVEIEKYFNFICKFKVDDLVDYCL